MREVPHAMGMRFIISFAAVIRDCLKFVEELEKDFGAKFQAALFILKSIGVLLSTSHLIVNLTHSRF